MGGGTVKRANSSLKKKKNSQQQVESQFNAAKKSASVKPLQLKGADPKNAIMYIGPDKPKTAQTDIQPFSLTKSNTDVSKILSFNAFPGTRRTPVQNAPALQEESSGVMNVLGKIGTFLYALSPLGWGGCKTYEPKKPEPQKVSKPKPEGSIVLETDDLFEGKKKFKTFDDAAVQASLSSYKRLKNKTLEEETAFQVKCDSGECTVGKFVTGQNRMVDQSQSFNDGKQYSYGHSHPDQASNPNSISGADVDILNNVMPVDGVKKSVILDMGTKKIRVYELDAKSKINQESGPGPFENSLNRLFKAGKLKIRTYQIEEQDGETYARPTDNGTVHIGINQMIGVPVKYESKDKFELQEWCVPVRIENEQGKFDWECLGLDDPRLEMMEEIDQ